MAKPDLPGFTTVNVRFPNELMERVDACLKELKDKTPGITYTRSDVIRVAVEEYTRGASSTAKPAKKVASR